YQNLIWAAAMMAMPATTQIVAGEANRRIQRAPPAIAVMSLGSVEGGQAAMNRPGMPPMRPWGTASFGPAQVLKVSRWAGMAVNPSPEAAASRPRRASRRRRAPEG